ncbi:hypothetical protein FACS1894216_10880 [Synergistales bacterium]|nr:hypothetical protein FACS1894216_10880 [Synergistales bacterium]
MSPANKGDDVKLAVEWVRNRESPGNKRNSYVYAKAVHIAFDEIKALQADNFPLTAICKGFEESGFFPQDSKLRSFCQALKREEMRRNKRGNDSVSANTKSGAIVKTAPKAEDKAPSPSITDEEKAEKRKAEAEKRRIEDEEFNKKFGIYPDPTAGIGNGVKKLSNGGFKF